MLDRAKFHQSVANVANMVLRATGTITWACGPNNETSAILITQYHSYVTTFLLLLDRDTGPRLQFAFTSLLIFAHETYSLWGSYSP